MEIYPFDLLPASTERWRLTATAINGGVAVSAPPRLARTDGGGFWMCWMSDIALDSAAQLREARRLEAILDSGATEIEVPCFEHATRKAPAGVVQAMTVRLAAGLRATTLHVQHQDGFPFAGGERFSIRHPTKGLRLYTVARIDGTSAGAGGLNQTIQIRPPLRQAASANSAVEINKPGCKMRLANPDDFAGALDALHTSVANAIWAEVP